MCADDDHLYKSTKTDGLQRFWTDGMVSGVLLSVRNELTVSQRKLNSFTSSHVPERKTSMVLKFSRT